MYQLYMDDGSISRGENVMLMGRWNVNEVIVVQKVWDSNTNVVAAFRMGADMCIGV